MALLDGDDGLHSDDFVEPELEDGDFDVTDGGETGGGDTDNAETDDAETDHNDGQRGISLADLGKSFAKLLGRRKKDELPAEETAAKRPINESDDSSLSSGHEDFVVSPSSILEAMLFVGHPDNEQLSSRQLAGYIRGVSPQEVDQLVAELNKQYETGGLPYEIVTEGDSYHMVLRDELAYIRERFYGRMREARLSQPAIDVLAVVAYHQPTTRQDVDRICQRQTGSVLSQLVRRQLLFVEQTTKKPRKKLYHTTDRFLQLFGIESIEDLPRPQDAEDE